MPGIGQWWRISPQSQTCCSTSLHTHTHTNKYAHRVQWLCSTISSCFPRSPMSHYITCPAFKLIPAHGSSQLLFQGGRASVWSPWSCACFPRQPCGGDAPLFIWLPSSRSTLAAPGAWIPGGVSCCCHLIEELFWWLRATGWWKWFSENLFRCTGNLWGILLIGFHCVTANLGARNEQRC